MQWHMKLRINHRLGFCFPLIYDSWMIYEGAICFSSLMIHLGVLALSAAGKLIVSMLIKSGIDEVRLFVGMKR